MIKIATVLKNEYIASDKRELILKTNEEMNFKPGQYITILAPTPEGKQLGRSFSIASLSDEKEIVLLMKIIPGGLASGYVDTKVNVGDEISFVGPTGKFLVSDLPNDFVFIATGAGLAPFIPMIDLLLKTRKNRITLIMGFRHEENVCYFEKLSQWQNEHPNFEFMCTLSQPKEPDTWTGLKGRVTDHLRAQPELIQDKQIYICGNGSMVNEIEQIALEQGHPKEMVFYEKYNNL